MIDIKNIINEIKSQIDGEMVKNKIAIDLGLKLDNSI